MHSSSPKPQFQATTPLQELTLCVRRMEPTNFALGLLLGCFLLTFAYFSAPAFFSPSVQLPNVLVSPSPSASTPILFTPPDAATSHNANATFPKPASKFGLIKPNVSAIYETKDKDITEICKNETQLCETATDSASNKSSINVFGSTPMPPSIHSEQLNMTREKQSNKEIKKQVPLCDLSQRRIDKCEIEGDVRIMGRNATVIWVPSPESDGGPDYERKIWQIKPYPRKEDPAAMANVRVLTVKPMDGPDDSPACTLHRDVPAIVFSDRGYTGNYFHDFTDVLIPIFTTARKFQGEVEFLVTDMKVYLIVKYLPIFKNLTKYDIVDFDSDDQVRCYPKAYIGLTSHDDFGIDPNRIPERYTIVDFARFIRTTYGLTRDIAEIPIQKTLGRKPRILIVARARSRKFMNLDEIVHGAEKLGFEVVAKETTHDLEQLSVVVNSCDVIMGVHGAGLTNMVFLPINAVFIQILPWGGLEWVAGNYFKRPVEKMRLKYMQYDIAPEESTLIEEYPRNHTVFTNPESIRRQGWNALKEVFLDKQNVRLNMKRFRPILKKAFKYLNSVQDS